MAEYIDREALIADIDAALDNAGMGYVIGQTLKRYVKRQPAADVVEVKHGEWIDGADSFGAKRGTFRVCSRCNICFPRDDRVVSPSMWRGCPNCFARMDLKGEQP